MTAPINFASASPRFSLPLLFPGQAQKEFFVNEAHALTDALLHPYIEGESDAPPASPAEGQAWIVGAAASAEWADNAGDLALRQSGNWLFCTPQRGMTVFDGTAGCTARFDGNGWRRASAVAAPQAGTNADAEARTAITGLISALVEAGILPLS